jgi:hypothetical protein
MYTNYIDIIVYLFHQIESMLSNTIKYQSNNSLNRYDFKGMMCMCCCC